MEIKATDLRVGNILNYDTSEGDTVTAVIDWQDIKWISEDPKGFNLVHSPIPLTEEWLEKFGKYKVSGYPYKFMIGFIKIRNGIYFFKYYNLEVDLPFVHNIQNLYHALSGQEL